MPIYEYSCQACGHEEEVLQKISDPVLTQCPACQKQALKKKVSAAGFRLKGGGWYETDFKSGNKKNVAGDKSGSGDGGKTAGNEKDGGKKSDSGSTAESKPAAASSSSTSDGSASTSKSSAGSSNTSPSNKSPSNAGK